MRPTSLLLAIPAFSAIVGAQPARRADNRADNSFSTERLKRADAHLQGQVDSSRIAGAVGLVLRDGKVVYERAFGWADNESSRRMTPDAMFRIASQTKALTSIAIMILYEEGRIALGNPVSRFIPAYARTTVSAVTTYSAKTAIAPT